ncbi:unnamed protein product [Rotaria magnacalcarata]|uniref:Helitron helicase-like domain-containing protein n=1 Tax=Rotaria magnacalcarata TaxID=392030 RepID=A0A819U441_9BILA|nr:unnamed protein product [Rotaria magnacalcarata]
MSENRAVNSAQNHEYYLELIKKSNNFREFIRQYNNANAFASIGAKIEDIPGNGPHCFKISGEVYHCTSENIQIYTTLQPNSVQKLIHQPSYAELYVYDVDTSIEIRMTESGNARCLRDNTMVYNALRTADDIAIVYVADRDGNISAEPDFEVQPSNSNTLKRINHATKIRNKDNMVMVRKFGRPDLFITFTCNPKWEEIKSELKAFQNPSDRPDLVTRGLPHAHCLSTLSNEDKIKTADDFDNIISAELPDRNVQSELYNIIITQNIHGPCGRLYPKSICMVDGSCSKKVTKAFCNETDASTDGYSIYRRRNNSNDTHFTRNNIQVDNRFVVPYNSFLSLKCNAHINVELC